MIIILELHRRWRCRPRIIGDAGQGYARKTTLISPQGAGQGASAGGGGVVSNGTPHSLIQSVFVTSGENGRGVLVTRPPVRAAGKGGGTVIDSTDSKAAASRPKSCARHVGGGGRCMRPQGVLPIRKLSG